MIWQVFARFMFTYCIGVYLKWLFIFCHCLLSAFIRIMQLYRYFLDSICSIEQFVLFPNIKGSNWHTGTYLFSHFFTCYSFSISYRSVFLKPVHWRITPVLVVVGLWWICGCCPKSMMNLILRRWPRFASCVEMRSAQKAWRGWAHCVKHAWEIVPILFGKNIPLMTKTHGYWTDLAASLLYKISCFSCFTALQSCFNPFSPRLVMQEDCLGNYMRNVFWRIVHSSPSCSTLSVEKISSAVWKQIAGSQRKQMQSPSCPSTGKSRGIC